MIFEVVLLFAAAIAFALSAADMRHLRINLQSLGLLFLAVALLVEVWLK